MIGKIKLMLKSQDGSRILKNFVSLSVLQGMNYLLPLLTVPYLTRVLGPGKYGVVGFTAAFINYFKIFTDYGFNLSATKEISIHRENKQKVTEIFSAVMVIKLLLTILSFVIMYGIIISFRKFQKDEIAYILTFGLVIGGSFFPVWFFQGMESMKYITYLTIGARAAATALTFVLVTRPEHFINLIALNSICTMIIGIISLWIVYTKFGIRFTVPSVSTIKKQLVEGWYIFISSVSTVLYSSSTIFILGLFTNDVVVGYYQGADKIKQAVEGLFSPVFQAIYPYVNKIAQKSKEEVIRFVKKEILYIGGLGLLSFITLYLGAELWVDLILGKKYKESVDILKILSLLPFLVTLGNIIIVQFMLSVGMQKDFSFVYVSSSIIGTGLMVLLTYYFDAAGTAASIVIIEIIVLIVALYRMQLRGYQLFQFWGVRKQNHG
ncbi:MAG: flippase [Clostridia bacterium]|nr:flippase [Clostridia bacterium]